MAKDSLFLNVVGFFAVPIVAGIASRFTMTPADDLGAILSKSLAAHTAAAIGSWYLADSQFRPGDGWHAFFRGGMWGSGSDAALGALGLGSALAFSPAYLKSKLPSSDVAAANPALSMSGTQMLGESLKMLARMKAGS